MFHRSHPRASRLLLAAFLTSSLASSPVVGQDLVLELHGTVQTADSLPGAFSLVQPGDPGVLHIELLVPPMSFGNQVGYDLFLPGCYVQVGAAVDTFGPLSQGFPWPLFLGAGPNQGTFLSLMYGLVGTAVEGGIQIEAPAGQLFDTDDLTQLAGHYDVSGFQQSTFSTVGFPSLTFTIHSLELSGLGLSYPGTEYCLQTAPNSAGSVGRISALGTEVAAQNRFTLKASQLPPTTFGYFLNSQTQGFVPMAGGSQGNLCLGAAIGRYNAPGHVQLSDATGVLRLDLDLNQTPTPSGPTAILAGQAWSFQCWYRDLNPSATSNFTSGLLVSFQ